MAASAEVRCGPMADPKKPAVIESTGLRRTRPRLNLTFSPEGLAALEWLAESAGDLSLSSYLENLVMREHARKNPNAR